MGLRDLPGAGAVASVAALLGDLILNGGDVLITLLSFLLTSPESWLSLVMYGQQLAGFVDWLPVEPLKYLAVAGLVLTIAVSLGRLVDKWRESYA